MNDALKMQISAFVDGELPENESELLLRRLSQDIALREQVALYLRIGRLIRRDGELPGGNQLRDRIWAALGEEPVQQASVAESPASRFTRPAVGMAIAASVAVLALFVLQQVYTPDAESDRDDGFTVITVPDRRMAVEQPGDELLEQFYLHHDPRLVTWQLQDGALIEIKTDDELAEGAESLEEDPD